MDTKDLRIVVIPTETNNDIDQNSTVEEILTCDERDIYTISNYCQDQNDENTCYGWTFLIDIKNKINLTGCEL
jgi:hypothetical protein